MTDFYVRLEEQLVTAADERAAHGAIGRAVAGRRPQLLAALAVAAVLAAGVTFLPGALESDDAARPAGPPPAIPGPVPAPAAAGGLNGIRVAVLNASTQTGLARDYADRLEQRRATITTIGNYYDQGSLRETLVRYRPGARAEALRVAAALNVSSVTQATAADAVLAGDAQVVVLARTGATGIVPQGTP